VKPVFQHVWVALPLSVVCAVVCSQASQGCNLQRENSGSTDEAATAKDFLDGAYERQGGNTPVNFVFRKPSQTATDDGTFFGEIESDGQPLRAEGSFTVDEDDLGNKVSLTLNDQSDSDDLVSKAFSGTIYYLKIGKRDTILFRADATGKTAQYRKVPTWCGTKGDKDCRASVQSTGLSCASPTCTSDHTCTCDK
jgi:hypothetical protein